jgi:signal transduction histidine kinase
MLEDDAADAKLIAHTLRQGGISFSARRVETKADFLHELGTSPPDLILSDYALPSFDGYRALAIVLRKCPHIPFIFVTGTLGEEVAIETLKHGATDYVIKTRLSRLVPSVRRAMREAEERAERKRAEAQLRASHEQLRALSVYLQYVREEERTRIAREVHDELGQALTGLKLDLARLGGQLPKRLKLQIKKIRTLSTRIDTTIQAVRRISTELRPGILDDLGLVAAIEWQANDFQTRTGIKCEVVTPLEETVLDQNLNTAFFRAFQETLTNVIRHAEATRVDVLLRKDGDTLVMEVHDNGRGISAQEISDTHSIGLRGMRERAALLAGEVTIQGIPGKGTTVTVSIPLGQPEEIGNRIHENSHRGRSRGGARRIAPHLGR